MREWKSRHARNKIVKREKGPVGPGEKEEEEDTLETFFCKIHEFLNPVTAAPVPVPAELPPHYAINFVPANVPNSVPVPSVNFSSSYSAVPSANSVVPFPSSSVASSPFSVVSSAHFVFPASPTHCMPTT